MDLIKFVNLLFYKSRANLRSEVSRLYLNYLWWALEPLFSMAIYYIVFGVFMNSQTPHYALFLLIGTTQWQWFANTLEHMASSIYNSSHIMQQVDIPKIFFPLEIFLQDTFKHLFVLMLLGVLLVFYPISATLSWVTLPLLLVLQGTLIIATGLLCAAFVPFFPDFRLLLTTILNVLLFISGIFFDVDMFVVPQHRSIMYMNPMAGLIREYRHVIIDGMWPDFRYLTFVTIGILGIAGCRFVEN